MELPDTHALVTLLVAAGAFYLYTRPWIRIEMVSVLLLLALLVIFHFFPFISRDAQLTEVEVLGSFGHPALVAICCLMILARGLTVTGALEPMVRLLARIWSIHPVLGLLVTLIMAGAASAFINDTPLIVLLLPVLISLAQRTGTSPARSLMPVSFAVLAGGMLTAIGTSTNVLVLSIASDLGMQPMGVFDFTSIAAAGFGAALVYLWLIAPRLLPDAPLTNMVSPRRYDAQVELTAEHRKLVGRSLARAARAFGQAGKIGQRGVEAAVDEHQPRRRDVGDQRRIHGDIAVVADEQVWPLALEILESRDAECGHRVVQHPLHIAFDLGLEGGHGLNGRSLVSDGLAHHGPHQGGGHLAHIGHLQMGHGVEKLVIGQQALQHRPHFVVVVGADIFKGVGVGHVGSSGKTAPYLNQKRGAWLPPSGVSEGLCYISSQFKRPAPRAFPIA